MKIGIFGGSFNPPHNMHKKIALDLINNNYLDKVIYVPTGNRYQKKDLIDVKNRVEMLNLMCEDNKNLEVSNFEQQKTLVYTYQTLDYFKEKYLNDQIYFICGSDNIKEFHKWKKYDYILNNYQVLVVLRNNDTENNILNHKNIIITNITLDNLSSTQLRKELDNNKLDSKVYNYIQQKKLYK